MSKQIILEKDFEKDIKSFIKKNKLDAEDFEELKKELVENPRAGDLIQETGGMRKARLKSVSKGKSGGFRVLYFDYPAKERLYFVAIYIKTEKEDITGEEKKVLKAITTRIKTGKKI